MLNKKLKYRLASFAVIASVSMVAVTGCSSNKGTNQGGNSATEAPSETPEATKTPVTTVDLSKTVLTMDDQEISLKDIMYILYSVEASANEQAMYSTYFGYDFWNDVDEETGLSGKEAVKQSVLETVEMVEVLYEQAVANKLTLSEDETEAVDDEVATILENVTGEFLTRTGFTEESLKEAVTKYYLALQYYEAELDKVEVDEEQIKSEIKYEDYKQSEIEYIFIPTILYDEEGNETTVSAEETTAALEKGNKMLESIKSGKSFEEAAKLGEDIEQLDVGTFAVYNEEGEMEDSLYTAFNTLKVGDVYDGLVEVTDGYYIIKFLDDNCTDDYDAAIEEQITSEKEANYMTTYEKLAEKHTFTVNEEVWNAVDVGNYAFEEMDLGFEVETDEEEAEATE